MTDVHDRFENPLAGRYASREMSHVFSGRFRFGTWRRLWLALAESQHELGLPISEAQLDEIRAHQDDIDFDRVRELERELRHDVMAHVHALREVCPDAGRILHLGATSCFVTDNSELVQIQAGLDLVARKLRAVMRQLRDFAMEQRDRPTVGFTHFQPAQFTTVGKRAALWLQDLLIDHEEVRHVQETLRFRGVKGTTGTQDSFLKLFDGDEAKVLELDARVARKMGFERVFQITGQTYTRKQDARVVNALSGVAQSAGKLASDMRLLCHMQELEEPFGKKQIGSSAMAYKRNPMRSERIAALSRWLVSIAQNPAHTAATQWFERTLDDSANRRLALGEAFLCADAILELLLNVTSGIVVQEEVIARHVAEQLPFIASEEVMMEAARAGGDRQELHEIIRRASIDASTVLKREGGKNPFLDLLEADAATAPAVARVRERLQAERFTGRAASQVERFVADEVDPLLGSFAAESFADQVSV